MRDLNRLQRGLLEFSIGMVVFVLFFGVLGTIIYLGVLHPFWLQCGFAALCLLGFAVLIGHVCAYVGREILERHGENWYAAYTRWRNNIQYMKEYKLKKKRDGWDSN